MGSKDKKSGKKGQKVNDSEPRTSDYYNEETIDDLEEQLDEAQAKVAEYWDQVVRSKAEMENIKRRAKRDVENARKYSVEKFASDLLPVVDSMEQGIETSQSATDVAAIREGMVMTTNMLINTLEKQGLIQVHPHGEKFDPEYHEAMSMLESDEVAADHVITVFQKGYQLNGRLVRAARVIVSRGNADVPSIDEQA
ncbi:MAG: nucleotide exchange factor GrpE [Gammaproteobacteria bacterium]|nr:nucleotide exchange factor GrpE [Gammaproteobacteria bacterium]